MAHAPSLNLLADIGHICCVGSPLDRIEVEGIDERRRQEWRRPVDHRS